jgi:site-specific recombinase XerD
MNLMIFRLSTCRGLRVSELCGLHVGDVRVGLARPYLYVRKDIGKGHKGR